MKILVAGGGTGGHLMPALAIAQGIRTARPDLEPVLVGALRGIEREILPNRDFRFHLLPAEPIYRREWWRNARWVYLAPRLIRATDALLNSERPAVVVGTGGYAAGSVLWRAAGRAIPTAVHEANAFPGIVTRLLARRVNHVYLGFSEARESLPAGRRGELFVTGNPVRPPQEIQRVSALAGFGLPVDRPVLLVTGGSQGALGINRAVADLARARRLDGVSVIWSTGMAHFSMYQELAVPGHIAVTPFLDPIDEAYAAADIALTRAGAMTLAEHAAWGLPAILVPLPSAAEQHQLFNARSVEQNGGAVVIVEDELEPDRLIRVLMGLVTDAEKLDAMGGAQRARARLDATGIVVSKILTLVP